MIFVDLDEINGCDITYLVEFHSFSNERAILVFKYSNLLPYGVLNKVDLLKKCI